MSEIARAPSMQIPKLHRAIYDVVMREKVDDTREVVRRLERRGWKRRAILVEMIGMEQDGILDSQWGDLLLERLHLQQELLRKRR